MKKISYLFLSFLLGQSISAQHIPKHHDHHGNVPCHTEEAMDELRSDPLTKALIDAAKIQLEQFTQYYLENEYDPTARQSAYVIPVVFHVLHTGGPENISDAQIYDAMARINEDFNKQNNNWMNVNSAFLGIVADVEVEFILAKKKPNGECFKGITRTFTTAAYGSGSEQHQAVLNTHGNFQGNRYLNIFVVPYANGAAGYTNYPWSTNMSAGIYILHNYVGRIGTSSNSVSTALSHEIGHWFNLPHTWGNSNNPGLATNCNSDDNVADTPNTIGWTSCNLNGESCGSLDNVENFMEYSYCSKMFTNGQKARMHAALNSTVGGRNNLHTNGNLNFTGVYEPLVFCRADFSSSRTETCPGASIQFTDESVHTASQWSWSFPGGTPSSSTEQNPVVFYDTPGAYSVTLTAGDGTNSNTKTNSNFISVVPSYTTLPFAEGFEAFTNINNTNQRWSVVNLNDDNAWQITTGTAFTGSKSVTLSNINQNTGSIDRLISQPFDLSDLAEDETITLSFRISFKRRMTANTDALRVKASTNCGDTWSTRRTLSAGNLQVGDIQSTAWIPSTQDDWKTWHVTNMGSNYFVENLRLMFEFTAGGGNNIYLDDINLYLGSNDPLGLSENIAAVSNVVLYPNPAESEMTLELNLEQDAQMQVSIVDLAGKTVQNYALFGQAGVNAILFDVKDLSQGMYMVRVLSQNGEIVKPFVKK
jgi:PKD repeat protein